MDTIFRGSRKHVLDWTDRPEFCVEMLQLVRPVDVRISARSQWMPRGYDSTEEARLETFGPEFLPNSGAWPILRNWWLCHERGANTPNWDIAVGCEINGRPGLILVEAKANVPELSIAGKPLPATASTASKENHQQIRQAINEACAALQQISPETSINLDSHYQLSNRVAFAWKLASLGIPTILVYLGFSGDNGIVDAGAPFRDSAHWGDVFAEYAYSLVPKDLFERRIDCGKASTWLLVRTRPIIEVSPPRSI
jgi:hypothetical protein